MSNNNIVRKAIVLLGLVCFFGSGIINAQAEKDEILVADLIEMAPRAKWINYYGDITFGSGQAKTDCACYRYDVVAGTGRGADSRAIGTYSRTLFTPGIHDEGVVRGKYFLLLPQAEKLTFKANLISEKHSAGGEVSIGIQKKGERIKYLIKKKKTPCSFECDLTPFAGEKVNIILKTVGKSVTSSWIHWTKAEIIAGMEKSTEADLSLFPNSVKLIPEGDGKISLGIDVRNRGLKISGNFKVLVISEKIGKVLEGISGDNLTPGKVKTFYTKPFILGEGKQVIKVAIETAVEKEFKNSSTLISFTAPYWPVFIRSIEVTPYPWRGEEITVTLEGNISSKHSYALLCEIDDFLGSSVFTKKISVTKKTIAFKPELPKLGWFSIKARLLYKGRELSSLKEGFCKAPEPRPAREDSVFGFCSDLPWHYWTPFDIEWQRFASPENALDMYKYTGASFIRVCGYVRLTGFSYGRELADSILNQGQKLHIMVTAPVHSGDSELPKKIAQSQKLKEALSYFKGKGVWFSLSGEVNSSVSPSYYSACLKEFAEILREVAPDAKISAPCLFYGASVFEEGKQGNRIDWAREFYAQSRQYIDAFSTDGGTHLKAEAPFYDLQFAPLKNIISSFGDEDRIPVQHLEYAVKNQESGNREVRVYLYILGQRGLGKGRKGDQLWIFSGRDYWTPIGSARGGVCKFNMYPRPVYQAYAMAAYNLTGAEFINAKDIGEDRYCYVFERDKERFAYLWKGSGRQEIITLPAKRGKVKVVDMMGGETNLNTKNKTADIIISINPILVRGLDLANFKLISIRELPDILDNVSKKASVIKKELDISKSIRSLIWYKLAEKAYQAEGVGKAELYLEGAKDALGKPIRTFVAYSGKIPVHIVDNTLRGGRSGLAISEKFPKKPLLTYHKKSPIKLDGNLSDWEGITPYPINKDTCQFFVLKEAGAHKGRDDLSGNFYSQWDDKYLYFAFDVKDNAVGKWQETSLKAYGGDGVELFIDVCDKRNQTPGMEFSHYFFDVNEEKSKIGTIPLSSNTRAKTVKKDKGYTMEIAIPLEELVLTGVKEDYIIAFDFYLNDADDVKKGRKLFIYHGVAGSNHNAVGAGQLQFR